MVKESFEDYMIEKFLTAGEALIKKIKNDYDLKRMLIEISEFFCSFELESEQIYSDIRTILSKENMVRLANEIKNESGYTLKDKLFDCLVNLIKEYDLPTEYTEFLTSSILTMLLKEISERDLEKYDRYFQGEWRKEEKALLENILQKLERNEKRMNDKKIREPRNELFPNLSTCEYFVEGSRKQEISWLTEELEKNHVVFVWGYGGIGKTEFVQEFARCRSQICNISFVSFKNSMRDTIIWMKFTEYEMPDLGRMLAEERNAVEEKIYQEKCSLLNTYGRNDILVVDNFEKKGKTLNELKRENAYQDIIGLRMHIIFITRNRPDTTTPEIKPLKREELLRLMKRYLGEMEISEEVLLKLIEVVDCHTMTVELIAKLLADEFSTITPQQILNAFSVKKLKKLENVEIESSKDRKYKEATIYEHIRILFDIAALSDKEKEVLKHAFFISEYGMKTELFIDIGDRYWNSYFVLSKEDGANKEKYSDILRILEKKGWIRVKEKTLFLHALVKEVIWEEENVVLDEDFGRYLQQFWEYDYKWECRKNEEKDTSFKMFQNGQYMRARYMANVFQQFGSTNVTFATKAASMFKESGNIEQSILYSHLALDILLQRKDEKETENFLALKELDKMWCPKREEGLWDIEYYWGDELYDDHSDKPEKIQNIYFKLQILHGLHTVNRNERFIEFSEDGKRLKKFNCFFDSEYTIPEGIGVIEDEAFKECIHLEKVVMPDSVEIIGNDVFLGCKNLKEIKLSKNLKKISYGAFLDCINLNSIGIPDSIEIIEEDAFWGCENLRKIRLSRNLTMIGDDAFGKCTNLECIIWNGKSEEKGVLRLPEKVKSVGNKTFSSCEKLKKVVLTKSIRKISTNTFENSSIECIEVDEDNDMYCSMGGCLFTKDRKKLLCCPKENTIFEVFDETEEIVARACMGNEKIRRVDLKNKIKKIGDEAFRNCNGIEVIEKSDVLEEIGNRTFENCNNLESIILPKIMKTIGEYAFARCIRMKKIQMPISLQSLGEGAFQQCYSLIYIELPESCVVVPYKLCEDCYELKEVVFSKETLVIRDKAFANCIMLKRIRNTENIKILENTVFLFCINLETPQFDEICKNVLYFDTILETERENKSIFMYGYNRNNLRVEDKNEIERILGFAKRVRVRDKIEK